VQAVQAPVDVGSGANQCAVTVGMFNLKRRLSKYEKALIALFLVTVPLVRPWIHGDGRGYYAFARAILFQGNLDFESDWYHGYEMNPQISDPAFRAKYLTPNGHFWNHWTIGPAMLWAPFLVTARAITPLTDKINGTHLAGDGFSKPYMIALGIGTLFYGLLTLWLSFAIAKKYVAERWAFLGTLGIWFATSFPFYLYVEPSFAHTHAAFLTALYVWYWDRTRGQENWQRWLVLGAIAGLLMDTYYPSVFVVMLSILESLNGYWTAWRRRSPREFLNIGLHNAIFAVSALILFWPTLVTKKILWGSYFRTGYKQAWYWNSPAFFKVCFSSHGALSWTPILIPAVLGIYLLRKKDRQLSYGLLATLLAFTYFIGSYQDWHAIPSFGNRFFISFTVFFVLGLAALLAQWDVFRAQKRSTFLASAVVIGALTLWNCGLVYQFAAHLFPQSGTVSWTQIAYNQFVVVPGQVTELAKSLIRRKLNPPRKDDEKAASASMAVGNR